MPRHVTRAEAELRGELTTVVAHAAQTGELASLEDLLARAQRDPEVSESLRLLVECDLEALRSRFREVAKSVQAWERLEQRACLLQQNGVLHRDDATIMSIRALHAQYVRRRGAPGDADRSVRMCAAELERRVALLDADDPRIALARANYAVALRASGTDENLAGALALLEEEALSRLTRYGPDQPFTWIAQVGLAQTQVTAAERATDPAVRAEYARAAAENAEAVLASRSRRYGGFDRSTLRAHLVCAEALLLLDRDEEAERQVRHVLAAARRPGVALDPGRAEFLLARALMRRSPGEARGYAAKALRAYRSFHGAGSRQAMAAARLVKELDDDAA